MAKESPLMLADFAKGGELGLAAAGVVCCSRGSESLPRSPPVLPRCLAASFEDRWMDLKFLGAQRQPEAGGGVHCSSGRMGAAGELLGAG